jgi:uncharacterized protein (DUF362 family)
MNAFAQESKSPSPPRGRPGRLFYDGEKPLLVVVEGKDLTTMLQRGIEALGGVDKLVEGKKVILKASLVAPLPAPVTTPVDFMVALGKLLTEAGGSHITINDASATTPEDSDWKFTTLKITPTANDAGFSTINTVAAAAGEYLPVADNRWKRNTVVHVSKLLYGADVVVNCPVVKRHGKAIFTNALKNHFGSVYGPERWKAHEEWEKGGDGAAFFMESIAEFAAAVNPELAVVDARTMLAKEGPILVEGQSKVVRADRIILGGDLVAVDSYCANLLAEKDETFSVEQIRATLSHAERIGLGTSDLKKVVIKEISA